MVSESEMITLYHTVVDQYAEKCGNSSVVEHNLAKVGVAGSSPVSRSILLPVHEKLGSHNIVLSALDVLIFSTSGKIWRRTQVAKGEVCKTFIQRFKSARRLH